LSQTASKGTPPIHSLTVNTSTNRVSGWSYDAAGNATNDGSRTYAYDANNRITQAGGGSAEYRYDGEGNRVIKVAGEDRRPRLSPRGSTGPRSLEDPAETRR
jgi:YD repeat-containing protein